MIIVKQLAAQLQVQLAAELVNPFDNPFRLDFGVLIVIKSDFHLPPPAQGNPLSVVSQNTVILLSGRKRVNGQIGKVRKKIIAFPEENRYTYACRVRDEDWVLCDPPA